MAMGTAKLPPAVQTPSTLQVHRHCALRCSTNVTQAVASPQRLDMCHAAGYTPAVTDHDDGRVQGEILVYGYAAVAAPAGIDGSRLQARYRVLRAACGQARPRGLLP